MFMTTVSTPISDSFSFITDGSEEESDEVHGEEGSAGEEKEMADELPENLCQLAEGKDGIAHGRDSIIGDLGRERVFSISDLKPGRSGLQEGNLSLFVDGKDVFQGLCPCRVDKGEANAVGRGIGGEIQLQGIACSVAELDIQVIPILNVKGEETATTSIVFSILFVGSSRL